MIQIDSIRYIIEYLVSIVASFLLFGMGGLLVYTRYKAKESIFYSKMLKQWIPSIFFVFITIIVARLLICYIYFPTIFTSTLLLATYTFFIIFGVALLFLIYFHSKKNSLAPLIIYGCTFVITSLSELFILFFIAHSFYNTHIPYQEILQPAFLLFLTRVLPYSLVLSSLTYILVTIARKNRDIFGRDYYIFTLQYCTKIAFIFSFTLGILSAISGTILTLLLSSTLSFSIFFAIVFFMPTLIFFYVFLMLRRVYRSSINPLQYRITFVIALLLILTALCIDVIAVQPYLL